MREHRLVEREVVDVRLLRGDELERVGTGQRVRRAEEILEADEVQTERPALEPEDALL